VGVVVVGGQGRGLGKTSVVCGLIRAMPEREWTAVKLSVHCHSAGVVVYEETSAGSETDSARYLAAGAERAFLVSAADLGAAMPQVREILASAKNVMIESASVLEYVRPDVALAVIDPRVEDVKDSLHKMAERFDAVIVPAGVELPEMFRGKQKVDVAGTEWASPELVEFVRRRL
jgi:hypothetical protein